MHNIFIVAGYGVPEDIFKDENYKCYLKITFNRIWDFVTESNISKPVIIFSGGKTDIFEPYERTEGGEMKKFFSYLAQRKEVSAQTQDWELIAEEVAISGLENMINSKKILYEKGIKEGMIYYFCEKTRTHRNQVMTQKVFGEKFNITMQPVDFDISANRYLGTEYIHEKEKEFLAIEAWAFAHEDNFKIYHERYAARLDMYHSNGTDHVVESIHEWWDTQLRDLYELAKKQPVS